MPVALVRHTRPEVAGDICYGSTDLDVAETFAEDCEAVIKALTACEQLISSPLRRCRLLADEIARHFGVATTVDERLREMDFGRWEGLRWSEVPQVEIAMWTEDFLHARPHGGESVAMLRDRTRNALLEYRAQGLETIIVTHSGVIKAALASGDTAAHFDARIGFGEVVKL